MFGIQFLAMPLPCEGWKGSRLLSRCGGRRRFCWPLITVTASEAMEPGASMAFRHGSGLISLSILKTVRSGRLQALNAMEAFGCVRVQGPKPGDAGPEVVSHP